jgi:hypothetical protein
VVEAKADTGAHWAYWAAAAQEAQKRFWARLQNFKLFQGKKKFQCPLNILYIKAAYLARWGSHPHRFFLFLAV